MYRYGDIHVYVYTFRHHFALPGRVPGLTRPRPCQTLASPREPLGELWEGWRSSGTSLEGTYITKTVRICVKRLNLGNESMYLHLPNLMDTISYALGPRDTKNDAKTISRSTHTHTHIKSRKQKTN